MHKNQECIQKEQIEDSSVSSQSYRIWWLIDMTNMHTSGNKGSSTNFDKKTGYLYVE